MALLTTTNLRHAFGSHIVLDGATLSIEPGEKIGLVGRNGQGKTTLLRAITGSLVPDAGEVQMQRGARAGYLSQDPDLDPRETVRDVAEGAFADLHALHLDARNLYEQMAHAAGDALDRLLKRQSRLESEIAAAGGYAIDHRIDAMLHGLGFTDDQFALPVSALSGGQKGRLALARLLLESPDLLLLDEPTNHLDIDGRQWLETFLADDYRGAVMVVSHDRWLLDRVVSKIVEVEQGRVRTYPGNYHQYLELRRERQLTQARVRGKQLGRIRQEELFIRRYKTGQRAKQARGRQSRLDRFKRDELVEQSLELDVMRLRLPKASRSGEQVVVADQISKSYGDLHLFRRLDLTVYRGERVGIIGPNGVGKTTLVRCLLGETEPDEGSIRLGSRLSMGYYRQLHEHLDLSMNVWQYLQSVIVNVEGGDRASEQQARDLAGAFLFSGIEQDKPLADLSGGERSRAVLAGLVAGGHNVLVLDEPSNHLDIPSAERLEQALAANGGYDGTLLLISHDRALLQATCDRLIIFEGDGAVRAFPGTFRDWQSRLATPPPPEPPAAPACRSSPKRKAVAASTAESSSAAAGVIAALAAMSTGRLESSIEDLQLRVAEIDAAMIDPDVYRDGDRCRDLQTERQRLVDELEPLEMEWARRAEEA